MRQKIRTCSRAMVSKIDSAWEQHKRNMTQKECSLLDWTLGTIKFSMMSWRKWEPIKIMVPNHMKNGSVKTKWHNLAVQYTERCWHFFDSRTFISLYLRRTYKGQACALFHFLLSYRTSRTWVRDPARPRFIRSRLSLAGWELSQSGRLDDTKPLNNSDFSRPNVNNKFGKW